MRQANRDYAYDIIGVRRDASPLEVKMAFRERAKETHPDINAGPEAKEEFIRLVAAYRATEAANPNGALSGASWPTRLTTHVRNLGKGAVVIGGLALIMLGWIYLPPSEPQDATQETIDVGGRVADADAPTSLVVTTADRSDVDEPQLSARNVEPVWLATNNVSSFGAFYLRAQPSLVLARAAPEVPDVLRPYLAKNAQDDQPITRSTSVLEANLPASQSAEEVPTARAPSFVAVTPPPRPKHIGQARGTRAALATKKLLKSSAPDNSGSQPATAASPSSPSILDQLPKLLGF